MKALAQTLLVTLVIFLVSNIALTQINQNPPLTPKERRNLENLSGQQSDNKVVDLTHAIRRPVSKNTTERMERGQAIKRDTKKYIKILKKMVVAS